MRGTPGVIALLALTLFLMVAVAPAPVVGQLPDSTLVPDTLQPLLADTEAVVQEEEPGPERITPRGAMIRSSFVPGWGHARAGAYVRGGFYFLAESAVGLMVFKTQRGISRTNGRLGLREDVVRGRLVASGETDEVKIEAALAEDAEVEDLRALKESRLDQREDWLALGIFLMLIGGVDAYVSAHLSDFPAAVVIGPTPAQGMELGISIPVRF
jgi:hypothetical protein